jgi:hypothetical protein
MTASAAKLAGAGALITTPFVASLKVFADTGSALDDLSQRTGISVQALSELKFAAEQSGASLDTIGKAARAMQKNGLDPRTFDEVVSSIAAIENPTMRAQKAFEVFGTRAGSELLPMLENLAALRDQARNLGVTMDDQTAKSAARLDDAFAALKSSVTAIAVAIGAAVAPAVTTLTELITANMGTVIQWLKENGVLVAGVAALGAGLTVLGGILGAAGLAFAGVTTAVAALLTPVGAVAIGIAALGAVAVAAAGYTGHLQRAVRALTNELPAAIKLLASYAKFRGLINQINSGTIPPIGQLRGRDETFDRITKPFEELTELLKARANNLDALSVPDDARDAGSDPLRRLFKPFEGVGNVLKSRVEKLDALKDFSVEFGKGVVDGLKRGPKQELATAIEGIGQAESRGTFSGRFASQILGSGRDSGAADRKKQIDLAAKQEAHLAEIRRKTFVLRTGNK